MAIPFLNHIDLSNNELRNIILQLLASDPTGIEGKIIYNTTGHVLKYYDGTSWVALSAGTSVSDASDTTKGITKLSVAPASPTNPIAYGVNDTTVVTTSTALAGDVTGTVGATVVSLVGGATAANVADAVTKRHTQNTDTGTTSQSFQLQSGSSGARIKNNAGILEVRDAADAAYANLKVNNLIVVGELDQVSTNVINTGDSTIQLNNDNALNSTNSNAGLKNNLLATDNTTRRDSELYYDVSALKWKEKSGPLTAAPVASQLARTASASIGDGSSTSIDFAHNLNNQWVNVTVWQVASPFNQVFPQVQAKDANTVTAIFSVAPSSNQYKVVVSG